MKRLVLALLLLSGPAFGQAPMEVIASDTIEIRPNQTRTFQFSSPISDLRISSAVAEIIAETDRTFTLRGLKFGQAMLSAFGPDGRVLYRANVSVVEPGQLVKIYGADSKSKDYVGYYCTNLGCGRADIDVPSAPFSTVVSETRPGPDGTPRTISREYR